MDGKPPPTTAAGPADGGSPMNSSVRSMETDPVQKEKYSVTHYFRFSPDRGSCGERDEE